MQKFPLTVLTVPNGQKTENPFFEFPIRYISYYLFQGPVQPSLTSGQFTLSDKNVVTLKFPISNQTVLSLVEITAFRLESKSRKGFFLKISFQPIRALVFLTGHVIFKLRYNQIYRLKTTMYLVQYWCKLVQKCPNLSQPDKDLFKIG